MKNKELITPRSRKEWAARITFLYRNTVSAIISVGTALIEAKKSLPHGDFTPMVKRDLPFSERTAQRLMQIAGNSVLTDPSHASALPPNYTTLALLASWPEDELRDALERGAIHPDVERAEVSLIRDFQQKTKQAITERAQPAPKPEAAKFTAVGVEPPAFRQPNGAALAFESSKKNAAAITEADFVELKNTAPPAEEASPKAFEEPPKDEDTPGLTALKTAWGRATATDREAFIRWVEP